ncbi:MAG: malate dehydrogenase, partial [Ilumatobacteraceae bacterium]
LPCTCSSGKYEIGKGLEIDAYSRAKIDASVAELQEERDAVKALGLI